MSFSLGVKHPPSGKGSNFDVQVEVNLTPMNWDILHCSGKNLI